jgi:DNA-binding CsgD family transcriptional regulator
MTEQTKLYFNITLSEREREIVGYVSSGLSASEIAMLLSISEHTVKVHKKNILKKMGCSNTAQMTALASLYGLTSPVRN